MISSETCEYIFVSSGTDEALQTAFEFADRFLTGYGPEARVVSFYDPTRTNVPASSPITYWTDLVASDDDRRIHENAVRRLDRLASGLTYDFLPVFRAHRGALYDYVYRAIVLQELLTGERRPLSLIVRGSGSLGSVASIKVQRNYGVPSDALSVPRKAGGRLAAPTNSSSRREQGVGQRKEVYLVAVEDSGSLVSLDPALAICQELIRQRCDPLVVTTSPIVNSAMTQAGVPVRLVTFRPLTTEESEGIEDEADYNIRRMLGVEGVDGTDRAFLSWIRAFLVSWARDNLVINAELERLDREYRVLTLLTIGVVNPLTTLCGEHYRAQARNWLAYFPIVQKPWVDVVSPKHEAFYLQANRYLTYGDYLADQLADLGIPRELTRTVGSTTYDKSHRRIREADREYTRTQILKGWSPGKKLVVVATECLQRPFEEIDPVVRNLLAIGGVHVVIKVHPADSPEMYQRYARSLSADDKLEVVASCDLMALLHAADLLIAVFSNIIINAAVLGTPTLVCDFGNKRVTLDFVAAELCLGCFDQADLPRILRELLAPSKTREMAEKLLRETIGYFNGPNDGQSAVRVAQELAAMSEPAVAGLCRDFVKSARSHLAPVIDWVYKQKPRGL